MKHAHVSWKAEDGLRTFLSGRIVKRSGHLVAFVVASAEDVTGEQMEANVRLIAAAPDLLEAARYAVDVIVSTHGASAWKDVLDRLDAAIAKAEG